MSENPIIDEIHRHREALARRFDYDLEKLFAYYKQCEKERDNSRNPLVDLSAPRADSCVVREESPGV